MQCNKEIFSGSTFRGNQLEICEAVFKNERDVLVVMPTGGGKSRCYQVPSLCLEGLTVVISPLTSLMQDQLASLHDVDVKTSAMYTSSISDLERSNILHALSIGRLKFLFVSPESLLGKTCCWEDRK